MIYLPVLAAFLCGQVFGGVFQQTPNPQATSVATSGVNLSTVTTALATKVNLAGDNMTGQLTTTSTITIQGTAFQVKESTAGAVGLFVVNSTGTYMRGAVDGGSVGAGYVDEIITTGMTTIDPISNTYVAYSTLTLTAGVWAISGTGTASTGGTTVATRIIHGISNSATTLDSFAQGASFVWDDSFAVNGVFDANLGPRYVSIATTTSYYLVCRITFSTAGGVLCGGTNRLFQARRIR